MELSSIIIQKIKDNGPISFHDFMEICLYHPLAGYYTSENDKIGADGDFYTASSISDVPGAMIGRQIEEMWSITGEERFTIVEYGAGTGRLCHDVLDYFERKPELYNSLQYFIIEKSEAMRQKERRHLSQKPQWVNAIDEIPPFTGCVFSNELVDNFSVSKVIMEDELMEVFVDYNNGFFETMRPAAKELVDYFQQLNINLPKGFQTEVNLEAIQWIAEIAGRLNKGYILTIDYGYMSSELYSSSRSTGNIRCYYKHEISDQPYINIGRQDITAHINFSALVHWGSRHGLTMCGFISQAGFLMALGYDDYLGKLLLQKGDRYNCFKQYIFLKQTLLLDMGQKFKVLIQSKGIPVHRLKCMGAPPQIEEGEKRSVSN